MKADPFYSNIIAVLRNVNMTERQRARAEDGVRKSAAIVEALAGMAGFGTRKQPKHAA